MSSLLTCLLSWKRTLYCRCGRSLCLEVVCTSGASAVVTSLMSFVQSTNLCGHLAPGPYTFSALALERHFYWNGRPVFGCIVALQPPYSLRHGPSACLGVLPRACLGCLQLQSCTACCLGLVAAHLQIPDSLRQKPRDSLRL